MKPKNKLLALFLVISIPLLSCSEDNNDFPRASTIKVINLINGEDNVIIKSGDYPINYATTESKVSFDDFRNFSIDSNTSRELQVVPESDTLNPIYLEVLNLKPIFYSLYFSGFSDGEIDHLLLEDNIKQFTDSVVGIRFINLSKTMGSIDIGISGETSNVVTGLDFQSVTDYIEFSAREADGNLTFEFRDASGSLLSTYIVDPLDDDMSSKKNLTLVFRKINSPFGGGALFNNVIRINNY